MAVKVRPVLPDESGRVSNSSQASPGSFISDRKRSKLLGIRLSTRQKSTASPTRRSVGSRRPRRIPTPPMKRSSHPRRRQATLRYIQPPSPPKLQNTRNTASAEAVVINWTRSKINPSRFTNCAGARSPLVVRQSASLQEVSTCPWFIRSMARCRVM